MTTPAQEACEDFNSSDCEEIDVEVSELVHESWLPVVVGKPVALFYVDAIVVAAIVYSLLCQTGVMSRILDRPALLWRWPVVGPATATAFHTPWWWRAIASAARSFSRPLDTERSRFA